MFNRKYLRFKLENYGHLDEVDNSSSLKDDFKQPCNEALIHDNSESIIVFNADSQF